MGIQFSGGFNISPNALGPTPTPTPTPTATPEPTFTPTPTPGPNYQWYYAQRFVCDPCTLDGSSILIRSSTNLINGNYYNIGNGYVYQLTGNGIEDLIFIDFDGQIAKSGTDCDVVCQL